MLDKLEAKDKEILIALFQVAHTIHLRLQDMGEELQLDSDIQQAIQVSEFKAHDLMVSLGSHLIDW